MNPTFPDIKETQSILKDAGFKGRDGKELAVDGKFWGNSAHAADAYIAATGGWTYKGRVTNPRRIAAVLQRHASKVGMPFGAADAYFGPSTSEVAERLRVLRTGQKLPPRPDDKPIACNVVTGVRPKCWSPSDAQIITRYGQRGQNQAMAHSPYPLRLDWDLSTTVHRFSCHQLLKERIERALEQVTRCYTPTQISNLGLDRFGGCLNVRKMRGGSRWSTHSWGIAIDWYPAMNQLRWNKSRAVFAKREYKAFMDIWAAAGFMSLGECYDFDWQHVQANP